jgi:RNA polymerase sigma-70 factor, ECF subfamily
MRRRFETLVDRHGPRLLQLATIILRSGDEAEDVVQDCLVKLWHHLTELDEGRELPWLVTCTRNACLDRLRRNRHQNGVLRRLHAEAADTPPASPDAAPEQATDRIEDARRLQAAIAQMAEPGRSLLILRDIQDTDVATVARTLGLSQTQVKVYTFRARRKLRLMLEEYAHEYVA